MTSDSLYLPNRSKFFRVKSCIETTVQELLPTDRFGMIVFGTTQHILFGLTEMTDGAKQYASKILQRDFEIPHGGTDILGAMKVALDELFRRGFPHTFSVYLRGLSNISATISMILDPVSYSSLLMELIHSSVQKLYLKVPDRSPLHLQTRHWGLTSPLCAPHRHFVSLIQQNENFRSIQRISS